MTDDQIIFHALCRYQHYLYAVASEILRKDFRNPDDSEVTSQQIQSVKSRIRQVGRLILERRAND